MTAPRPSDTAEALAPDRYVEEDGHRAPQWQDVAFVDMQITVWNDGIETDVGGFIDAEDISIESVERAGRVLLAVAAQMREYGTFPEARDV